MDSMNVVMGMVERVRGTVYFLSWYHTRHHMSPRRIFSSITSRKCTAARATILCKKNFGNCSQQLFVLAAVSRNNKAEDRSASLSLPNDYVMSVCFQIQFIQSRLPLRREVCPPTWVRLHLLADSEFLTICESHTVYGITVLPNATLFAFFPFILSIGFLSTFKEIDSIFTRITTKSWIWCNYVGDIIALQIWASQLFILQNYN